jgi:hypothetical protein
MAVSSSTYSKLRNGSVTAVTVSPRAEVSDSASRAWSKAGLFSGTVGSTRTNRSPPSTDFRYQKRLLSPIQFGSSATSTTRSRVRTAKLSARM